MALQDAGAVHDLSGPSSLGELAEQRVATTTRHRLGAVLDSVDEAIIYRDRLGVARLINSRTAELFCEAVGGSPIADDRLRPGAAWADLAQAMYDRPDARRVLFVGHEPDLSSAIAHLTGAASVRMRKGGLACVEFYGVPEVGTGELAWLLDPDLYGKGP